MKIGLIRTIEHEMMVIVTGNLLKINGDYGFPLVALSQGQYIFLDEVLHE
jgi:hypothetical protein